MIRGFYFGGNFGYDLIMNFNQRVYKVVEKIPKGKVMTYKQVAEKLNSKAYRVVGQALKNNPNPPIIPCHRVIRSDGSVGGFFGDTEGKMAEEKIKLLESEEVKIVNGKIADDGYIL